MNNNIKKIYGGLLPTPKEKQKYSFGAVWGYPDPKILPAEFSVGEPIEIKNQNIPSPSYVCVAESLCAVSEYQEGVALEPAFTCKLISEILGDTNWIFGGTDLHTGAKASLKGFLARQDSPHSIEKEGVGIVALPSTWAKSYDEIAMKHAKQAFFWIGTSGGNMFDKIRGAMYQFAKEKRAVQTGVIWNNEWTDETYIDKEGTPAGGHAIALIGWKDDYLKIQNSIGKEIGENGCQWIHKNLVNKLFTFGCLIFADLPENVSREMAISNSDWYRAGWVGKILLLLKAYWQEIMK